MGTQHSAQTSRRTGLIGGALCSHESFPKKSQEQGRSDQTAAGGSGDDIDINEMRKQMDEMIGNQDVEMQDAADAGTTVTDQCRGALGAVLKSSAWASRAVQLCVSGNASAVARPTSCDAAFVNRLIRN